MGIESKDAGKASEVDRQVDKTERQADQAARQTQRDTQAHQGDVARKAQEQTPRR